MADDVQDVYIATEAGDAGWQSLTELTASKVDAKLPIKSEDGTVVLSDSSGSFVVSTGGTSTDFSFTTENNFIVHKGEVKTASLSGTADNDPQFSLNGLFNFQFRNSDGGFGSKINVGYNTKAGGFANVGVGGCYWYLRDSKRFGIGATGINFNANAAANASTYDWAMETDGTFVANSDRGIETAYITAGRNNSGDTLATSPKIVFNGVHITAINADGSTYTPDQPGSIPTKKYCDDKVWVGTTAQYNAIATKNPTTLYCLTD